MHSFYYMRNIIYLVNFKLIKKHSVFINLHTMNLFNSFSGTKYSAVSVVYHFNLLLQGLTKKITYLFTNGTYSNTLRMTNIGWVKTWNVHLHTYFKYIGLKISFKTMVLKYVDAHFKKSTQKKWRKRMFERKKSLKK